MMMMMMMTIVALAARHKPWPCSMLNYPHDLLNLETNDIRMIPRRKQHQSLKIGRFST